MYVIFQGPVCANRCPDGVWGNNCSELCDCFNGASCNHITGECECKPGYTGDRVCHYFIYYNYYNYLSKVKYQKEIKV